MIRIPNLSRKTIDGWSIAGSGLPLRTVHGLARTAVRTVDDQPVHFRRIAREFNTIVHTESRRGTGHMLDILRRSPLFFCARSGYYQLRDTAPAAGT